MKARINITVFTLLVSMFFSTIVVFFTSSKGKVFDINTSENQRPDFGEPLNIVIPDPTDTAATIALAYQLYATANENYKNIENAAYVVNSVTTTMGIPVQGVRYNIKLGEELFFIEYSFVTGNNSWLLAIAARDSTMFAERHYTNANMAKAYKEKTIGPKMTLDENGKPSYTANWDKLYSSSEYDKPIFNANQTEPLEMTDQVIRPETIKEATITYNEEKRFYRLELVLDTDNPLTTSKTLPNVRAASNAPDAEYYSIVETIEIWDNGYYKFFHSVDKWTGTSMITLDSTIDFATTFYYNKEAYDINNYQYLPELRARFA